MCLESTKQLFILYSALKNGKKSGGHSYATLVSEMNKLSVSKFGTKLYSMKPVPIRSLLQSARSSGEVKAIVGGKIFLTDRGNRVLDYIESNEIKAELRSMEINAREAEPA